MFDSFSDCSLQGEWNMHEYIHVTVMRHMTLCGVCMWGTDSLEEMVCDLKSWQSCRGCERSWHKFYVLLENFHLVGRFQTSNGCHVFQAFRLAGFKLVKQCCKYPYCFLGLMVKYCFMSLPLKRLRVFRVNSSSPSMFLNVAVLFF